MRVRWIPRDFLILHFLPILPMRLLSLFLMRLLHLLPMPPKCHSLSRLAPVQRTDSQPIPHKDNRR